MNYINPRLHAIVVVVLLLHFHQSCTQQVESDPEVLLLKSIHSMEQTLAYFTKRGGTIEVSELLGLRVASAALLQIVEHCVETPEIYIPDSIIENVKLLCAKMNVLIPRIFNIYKPSNVSEGLRILMNANWKGFVQYRSIHVDREKREILETMKDINSVNFQQCLGDLLQIKDKCSLGDHCWKVLQPKIAKQPDIPYQAMVLAMIEIVGCTGKVNEKWDPLTLKEFTDDICYSMYPKVSAFHASNIPEEKEEIIAFLEAFFACSLLGFDDFLLVTHKRLSAIIEWQLPSGCFGIPIVNKDGQVGETKCIPTMSSAAFAQIGLYITWLLDPKGFAVSNGYLPFKRTSWFTFSVKLIIIALMLSPLFIRKVRRALWSCLGKMVSFFKSILKL